MLGLKQPFNKSITIKASNETKANRRLEILQKVDEVLDDEGYEVLAKLANKKNINQTLISKKNLLNLI